MAAAHCENGDVMFPAMQNVALPEGTMKNKIVLITGGGTGLGRGMAVTFAKLGAKVAIAARRLDVLQKTANEIQKESGNNNIMAVRMDVRDPKAISECADAIVKEFGSLPHVIVNNAAGNFVNATERLTPNGFKTVVDIVLNGTFNVTLEFGKRLIKAKQGCAFLCISAGYASTGSGFVVPSACAKAGVENMCRSLAAEWGRYGLRFNVIEPGPIFTEGAFSRLDPTGVGMKNAHERLPVGRLGKPQELANLATFMCSDYCSWMNGSVVNFDGGQKVLRSGEFNKLSVVTPDQWDQMEQMIRSTTGKGGAKAKL